MPHAEERAHVKPIQQRSSRETTCSSNATRRIADAFEDRVYTLKCSQTIHNALQQLEYIGNGMQKQRREINIPPAKPGWAATGIPCLLLASDGQWSLQGWQFSWVRLWIFYLGSIQWRQHAL